MIHNTAVQLWCGRTDTDVLAMKKQRTGIHHAKNRTFHGSPTILVGHRIRSASSISQGIHTWLHQAADACAL